MCFGGACCTAAAVTASCTAKKDDNICIFRCFTNNVFSRSSTYYSTNFHTFCHKAWMVAFFDVTCSKTDLVAVGSISVCCCLTDFNLWQFALDCFAYRYCRVCCTCKSHCLVNIASAAQRVTDCTAKTGCRTAERFNFCWVVVSFVFEHQQPFFLFAVDVHIDFYAASVDFFAFIKALELACAFEIFCTDCCKVHQCYGTVTCRVQFVFDFKIFFPACLNVFIFDNYVLQLCHKCCMTAVVRPVCIDHLDFCESWVSFFCVLEVVVAECQVVCIHCKPVFFYETFKISFCHINKAFKNRCFFRNRIYFCQCFWFFHGGFAAFHRVNKIFFDFFKIFCGNIA